MSRIGNAPVELPKGVKALIAGNVIKVEGPKGKLEREFRPEIKISLESEEGAEKLIFTRERNDKSSRAFHGLERSLVNNMVEGVNNGYEKFLDIKGTGYKASLKGKKLVLGLGFSHDIDFPVPDGVKATVLEEGRTYAIKLESIDKQLLGEVAAKIRSFRPPEPYKGKGVKYRDEVIIRKAGKAGAAK